MVATTARGGSHGLTVVSPTAVVECFSPGRAVFLRVPLRLTTVLLQFCLYIAMYLDIQRTEYTPILHSIFIIVLE